MRETNKHCRVCGATMWLKQTVYCEHGIVEHSYRCPSCDHWAIYACALPRPPAWRRAFDAVRARVRQVMEAHRW